MRRRPLAALLCLALVTLGAPAFAQTADELKAHGNQAMLELNYADALASYRAALGKNPSDIALYYNIGRAEQALGNYPAALDALAKFDAEAPPETKAKVPSLAQLLSDVRGRVGELTVRCDRPATGTIVVADQRIEGCELTPRKVRLSLAGKSSEVEIRFESTAFKAEPVKATVAGGAAPAEVLLVVVPTATTGFLRITAVPAHAIIAVDGVPKGNSPVELTTTPGGHVVDITAEAYEKRHLPVVIEVGGRKDLTISLEKTPPLTKRWWFWAGAGVIAAGIATAAVILVVQPEKGASHGTIEPGQVRAPLMTF